MNSASQQVRGRHLQLSVAALRTEAPSAHERELLEIAAFRLRDAAHRVASLVSMTTSPGLRDELLAACDRLLGEERAFTLRAHGADARAGRKAVRVAAK